MEGNRMKYLLLDIDDTIAPLKIGGTNTVTVDRMGIKISIPIHVAEWLKKTSKKQIKIFWCTDRSPIMGAIIEKAIGFKTEGQLQFFNKKAYNWSKLYSIIKFCNEHEDDLVILADNLVERMTKGVELPNNLELVLPSDATLTIEDLKLIDDL